MAFGLVRVDVQADAVTADRPATAALDGLPATMLFWQQHAGNAAVARVLGARPGRPTLARYEAGEHIVIGSPGKTLKIGSLDVTEAELQAMGDFYKSPEAMVDDAIGNKAKFEGLLKAIREDRDLRLQGKEGLPESRWVGATAHRPKGETYLDLAAANESHFAPGKRGANNKSTWQALHKQALDIAHAAAAGDKQVPDGARMRNGFAAHFLTDAFSAGHLIAKLDVMDLARTAFARLPTTGWKIKENDFSKGVAAGLLANPTAKAELDKRELKLITWGDFTPQRLSELIYGMSVNDPDTPEDESQEFFSLFARTVHDELDEAILKGKDQAIEVTNDNGDVWTLAGDETLRLSPETREIAARAVEASRANLETAARTPGALDYDALFQNVWRFVPRPTTKPQHEAAVKAKATAVDVVSGGGVPTKVIQPGSRAGWEQLNEAVSTLTDAGRRETVNAVVRLAVKKLDAVILKLEEKGRTRLKKK